MKRSVIALAGLALAASGASAQLFGSDNVGNYFEVSEIDGSATLITSDGSTYNFVGGATEIEIDQSTGIGYAQNPNGSFSGNQFVATTGASAGPTVFTLGSFTGLEYVGGTLFGAYITGGGGAAPSTLATLDPTTGASVDIGLTGVGPVTGLAYDVSSGIMYGSTAGVPGVSTSLLVTIDLGSGLATPIGDTGVVLGSIEFGSNGRLYGGGGQVNTGQIFVIDLGTATPTHIGDTGLDTVVTGLSLLPAPGGVALLGLGGLIAARRRR
ncbi:MAG: hypothetical protein H6811_11330 [Phycisphaeraceae bacterium]|nr:hypothetical protein [Phycisphaeraceae bacterium]